MMRGTARSAGGGSSARARGRMRQLDRYIGVTVIKSFVLVALALTSLFSLLAFVEQLHDVGVGHYQVGDALVYVALTSPSRLLQLVPVSGLLACLVALGGLAGSNELTAMQAMGISVARIIWAVFKQGALVILALLLIAEFIVPPAEMLAQTKRALTISQTSALRSENGYWARSPQEYLNVRKFIHGSIPADLDIYEFDDGGRLTTFIHADRGDIRSDGSWRLTGVLIKHIDGSQVSTQRLAALSWQSFLRSQQVHLLELSPESMAPTQLYEYIRDLAARKQQTARYEQALWDKIGIPVSTAAMVLISIPFVFGPLRTHGTGWRITLGTLVGMVFYLTNQITGYVGLLLNVNPAITALAPSLLLALIALYMLRRT